MQSPDKPTDVSLKPTGRCPTSEKLVSVHEVEERDCRGSKTTASEPGHLLSEDGKCRADSFDLPGDFSGTERFRLEEKLGIGGMSTVWRAYDSALGRTVALKAVHHSLSHKSARLKHEFGCLSGLTHGGIVIPHELHHEESFWFFTMELLDGLDWLLHVRFGSASCHQDGDYLRDPPVVRSSRALDSPDQFDRLRQATLQLVDALEYLHRRGIVHCDVKPSNVLVTPQGRVVLIDFGLVSAFNGRHPQCRTDVRLVGTAAYMAPELAEFTEPAPAVDWYAIGVMLYEALVGCLPFRGTFDEVMAAKRTTESPNVRHCAPGVPKDLADLCTHLLQSDPRRRLCGRAIRDMLATGLAACPSDRQESRSFLLFREDCRNRCLAYMNCPTCI